MLNTMAALDVSEVECLKVASSLVPSQPASRKAVCKAPGEGASTA